MALLTLPPELRMEIWRLTLRDNVIDVSTKTKSRRRSQGQKPNEKQHKNQEKKPWNMSAQPGMLLACKEIRRDVKAHDLVFEECIFRFSNQKLLQMWIQKDKHQMRVRRIDFLIRGGLRSTAERLLDPEIKIARCADFEKINLIVSGKDDFKPGMLRVIEPRRGQRTCPRHAWEKVLKDNKEDYDILEYEPDTRK